MIWGWWDSEYNMGCVCLGREDDTGSNEAMNLKVKLQTVDLRGYEHHLIVCYIYIYTHIYICI